MRTAGGADWVGILEAAYRPASDKRTWLQGVVEAARPALDCGLGVAALCFDAPTPGTTVRPLLTVTLGLASGFETILEHFPEMASPDLMRALFSRPCETASTHAAELGVEWLVPALGEVGVGDTLGVVATDPSGCACMLNSLLPCATRLSRGQVALWSRIFLVARRNDPRAPGLAGLTLRERQAAGYACLGHSNKLIAYELGLSASTVATYLTRAAAALGAGTRAGLIERYVQGAGQTPPSEGDGA